MRNRWKIVYAMDTSRIFPQWYKQKQMWIAANPNDQETTAIQQATLLIRYARNTLSTNTVRAQIFLNLRFHQNFASKTIFPIFVSTCVCVCRIEGWRSITSSYITYVLQRNREPCAQHTNTAAPTETATVYSKLNIELWEWETALYCVVGSNVLRFVRWFPLRFPHKHRVCVCKV